MPPTHLAPTSPKLTGRFLTFSEREEIAILVAKGPGIRAIARTLGRSPSTISRELRRNAATRGGRFEYRASAAQWHAESAVQRPRKGKLASNPTLRKYVEERLSGQIANAEGVTFVGLHVVWKKRRAVLRQHRRWATAWSPEQIAHRLRIDYPKDPTMRISHEAVYQSLHPGPRSLASRTDSMSALGPSAARAARMRSWSHQILCRRRDHDQRAPARSARPRCTWTLGGPPYPRAEQLCDRHPGRTLFTLHDAATSAAQGRISAR